MTYRDANDLIDDDDRPDGYSLAFYAFNATYSYSEDAESICDNCVNSQSCRFTEINDYSDSTIIRCDFFVKASTSPN